MSKSASKRKPKESEVLDFVVRLATEPEMFSAYQRDPAAVMNKARPRRQGEEGPGQRRPAARAPLNQRDRRRRRGSAPEIGGEGKGSRAHPDLRSPVAQWVQNHYYQSLMTWLGNRRRRRAAAGSPAPTRPRGSRREQDDVYETDGQQEKRGSLVAVGTGIRVVGQLTVEAIAAMKKADKLLYCVGDPIAEHVVKSLNEDGAESMFSYYAEGKPRAETYEQMIQRMLECVREGLKTCVALYGHPGVFAWPAHEAIRRARAEGYDAKMLPAVSAEDCLFADVGIDPAVDRLPVLRGHRFHDERPRDRHVEHPDSLADRRSR